MHVVPKLWSVFEPTVEPTVFHPVVVPFDISVHSVAARSRKRGPRCRLAAPDLIDHLARDLLGGSVVEVEGARLLITRDGGPLVNGCYSPSNMVPTSDSCGRTTCGRGRRVWRPAASR